ncbi:MAG TPA: N-acetyltransferase [Syntrophales bacterium]|nr:N-acetyltransferase [Syntrophales bacterium]HPQ44715.1 N-acetyltransferase [Syntrophales bacterium]
MIRAFELSDMNDVVDIWLQASIKAHSFVGSQFWESKIDDMRNRYIPASETYVYIEDGITKGFFSLHGDTLAAMFVSPDFQGKGIGQQLMDKAKSLRGTLHLAVYQENPKGIDFYLKCGFVITKETVDNHTGHTEIIMEYRS